MENPGADPSFTFEYIYKEFRTAYSLRRLITGEVEEGLTVDEVQVE